MALLTSEVGAQPFQALPGAVTDPDTGQTVKFDDGVVVEDTAERFIAKARIRGLKSVELVTGGPRAERRGVAEAVRTAEADIDVDSDAPFVVALVRDTPTGDQVSARSVFTNLAPAMNLKLHEIVGTVPCTEFFGLPGCIPGRDTSGDGFIDEIPCVSQLLGSICVPEDEAEPGQFVDPDGDGFAFFNCRLFTLAFSGVLCRAVDPDGDGLANDKHLGLEASYTAGSKIDKMIVRVDPGRNAQRIDATVADVPTRVDVCLSETEACTRFDDGTRNGFVFDFDANARVTFGADLCLLPVPETCTGSAGRLLVRDLSLQDLTVELDSKSKEEPLTIVLDTDPVFGVDKAVKGRFDLLMGPFDLRADLGDLDGDGVSGIEADVETPLVRGSAFAGPLPDGLVADRLKLVAKGAKVTNVGGKLACPEGFSAGIDVDLLEPITNLLLAVIEVIANLNDVLTDEVCATE